MNIKALFCGLTATMAACACAAGRDDGGMLAIWPKNHGVFLFVNAQDVVPADQFAGPVKTLSDEFCIDIRLVAGNAPDIRGVAPELGRLGAKGAIWIVYDPALPLTLGACEDGWGMLNVASIAADREKLGERIGKLMLRLFADIHGIGNSQMMPQCVMMNPAAGLAGIDALVCREYSPEAITKVSAFLEIAGYKQCQRGSYYDACEEGWAPPPTNAVQKAIWEKVHQLPTKPLTIQRESVRRKESR